MTIVRIFLTALVLFAGYECMVAAFRLLNLPSDRAVYAGFAALAALAFAVPFSIYRLWRTR